MFFQAVHTLLWMAEQSEVRRLMVKNKVGYREAFEEMASADRYVCVPASLARYLNLCSDAISDLAKGLDARKRPKQEGSIQWFAELATYNEREGRTAPDAALSLLTEALGFSRKGYNAFRQYHRKRLADYANDRISNLVLGHKVRPAKAKQIVMDELSFTDEREFRRFLKGAPKRLTRRGKPPP